MMNNKGYRRKKNKMQARIAISIGIPVLVIFLIFGMILAILGGFMPASSIETVEEYKLAAELAGCTWQELLVYDTVRFENDFENADPYLSAVDFLKMYYEIREWVEADDGGYWKLVSSGTLTEPSYICSWLGIPIGSNISAVLDASKGYKRPEFVVQFTSKELDDLILEKGFNEEQIQWADMLMTAGALEKMFGEIYVLPDYIESAGNGYFGWPVPELHTITSKFAASRKHPVLGVTRAHNGVDISGANAMGSPVVAIDDGVVIQVNTAGGERGMNIRVQHNIDGDIWVSRYQHLSAIKCSTGDKVKKGTVIGAVGNTGIGTGPHLHLELTYNGVLIDPLPLIQ